MANPEAITDVIGDYAGFVKAVLVAAREHGIESQDLEGRLIDHLCYRTVTGLSYEIIRAQMRPWCSEIAVSIHNGREFTILRLAEPLCVADYRIALLELPSPKKLPDYAEGLEHLEMVVRPDEFGDFVLKYDEYWAVGPGLFDPAAVNPTVALNVGVGTIKFHPRPLDEVMLIEGKRFMPAAC